MTLDEVLADFGRLGEAAGAERGGATAARAGAAPARGRRRARSPAPAPARARARMARPAVRRRPLGAGDDRASPAAWTSLGRPGERSRTATWEELASSRADVAVAMPCGYDAERSAEEARAFADRLDVARRRPGRRRRRVRLLLAPGPAARDRRRAARPHPPPRLAPRSRRGMASRSIGQCGRRDLNPHRQSPPAPKAGASTVPPRPRARSAPIRRRTSSQKDSRLRRRWRTRARESVHPNRDKPESKQTRAIVAFLLLVIRGALIADRHDRRLGQAPGREAGARSSTSSSTCCSRTTCPAGTAACCRSRRALAVILIIFAAVAAPAWFARDKTGFDVPAAAARACSGS